MTDIKWILHIQIHSCLNRYNGQEIGISKISFEIHYGDAASDYYYTGFVFRWYTHGPGLGVWMKHC